MGIIPAPSNCFFTGLPAKNIFIANHDRIDYEIEYNGITTLFTVYDDDWKDSIYIQQNKYLIKGLVLNGKWPKENKYLKEDDVRAIMGSIDYPKSPKEKLDNLFLEIYKQQEIDGQVFKYDHSIFQPDFWKKTYFKDDTEFSFYLRVLDKKGLLSVAFNQSGVPIGARTTYEGLNHQIQLTETGDKSNKCFVAMSFDDKNREIRNAIKVSLSDTGFIPILIDEQHFDAERTINDEIIANIKKSKFCVADFTDQKDGVYFEAGFALGRGMKVIYTCHADSFKKTHFDTNHFPHIIYNTTTELEEQLKIKIEAWIKN